MGGSAEQVRELQSLESHTITRDFKETLKFPYCSPFVAQMKKPRSLEFIWGSPRDFLLVSD